MSGFDDEAAAKQDIAARPEVSKGEEKAATMAAQETVEMPPSAANAPIDSADLEPDALEQKTGRVVAKGISRLLDAVGAKSDDDVLDLAGEVSGNFFAFVRYMNAPVWVRFLFPVAALGVFLTPSIITFINNSEKDGDSGK